MQLSKLTFSLASFAPTITSIELVDLKVGTDEAPSVSGYM